jgi:hypothetical protein
VSSLSLLEILCFLGGSFGTFRYRRYNDKAPFTAVDIEVLDSVKNPEIFLYTWNSDPRTYAMDSPALQDHRLGIYDWMQRCQSFAVWSVMNFAYDAALLVEDGLNNNRFKRKNGDSWKMSSLQDPGDWTNIPQQMISLFQMVGPIGAYPITQLETTDAKILQNSLDNPDPRFLQLWYSWVIELFTRQVRNIVSMADSSHPFVAGPLRITTDLMLVALPTTFWSVKIQYDTGKQIAKNDYPRQTVLWMGWIEIFGYYFDSFLPFIKKTDLTNPTYDQMISERLRTWIQVGKHVGIQLMNGLAVEMRIAYNISGMLSSSFQPEED